MVKVGCEWPGLVDCLTPERGVCGGGGGMGDGRWRCNAGAMRARNGGFRADDVRGGDEAADPMTDVRQRLREGDGCARLVTRLQRRVGGVGQDGSDGAGEAGRSADDWREGGGEECSGVSSSGSGSGSRWRARPAVSSVYTIAST